MKTANQSRGVALVLVLAFLALISVFVIGFFSSASGELTASTSYAAGITTRQLADSTINLVEGQIREATTRLAPDAVDKEKDFDAWASQPGMIRTFRGGTNATSDTTALYKLYSSDQMVVDETGAVKTFRSTKDIPPGAGGWYTQPALFTDINEPVSIQDPTNPSQNLDRYPVFDPKSFSSPGTPENAINPTAGQVYGAELTQDDDLPKNRQARMPVRWLYVLRDGTVAAPLTDPTNGGKTATFSTEKAHPTPENPIVGRIAFWTDDDTCKVNINTAGGFHPKEIKTSEGPGMLAGSYWDVPRYNTNFDRGQIDSLGNKIPGAESLALCQPAGGEFQRYPGHPATTSLAYILQGQLTTSAQIYNLTPRYLPSQPTAQNKQAGSANGFNQTKSEKDAQLLPKWDRLYSSVDEMLYAFSPEEASDVKIKTSGQRKRELGNTDKKPLTADQLDRLRFFLTAHSRAPELNLFGRPRISLWPMWPVFGRQGVAQTYPHNEHFDTQANGGINNVKPYGPEDFRKLMNPADRLLAFCSMVGNGLDDPKAKIYMFQRYNPYSSTDDWQIPRNVELLKFLTELTSTKIPGYGGPFSDPNKYGKDHTQIITEMFDYIRCINLRDSTNDVKPILDSEPPTQPGYAKNTYKYAPRGVVVPSVITIPDKGFEGTTGFGRYPTISEVAIVFYHAGYFGFPKAAYDPKAPNPPPGSPPTAVQNDITKVPMGFWFDRNNHSGRGKNDYWILGKMISCFLAIETFNPMQGYSSIDQMDDKTEVKNRKYAFIHHVTGLNSFAMSSESLRGTFQSFNMASDTSNAYRVASRNTWGGRSTGGYEGFIHPFVEGQGRPGVGAVSPLKMLSLGSGTYSYPFQAQPNFPPAKSVTDPKVPGDVTDTASPGFEDRAPMILGSVPNPANIPGRPPLPPVSAMPTSGILVRNSDDIMHFKGGRLTLETKWGAEETHTINEFILDFPDSPKTNGWPMPTDNIWNPGPATGIAGQYDSGGFRGESKDPNNTSKQTGAPGRAGWVIADPEFQFHFYTRVDWSQRGTYDPVTSNSTAFDRGGQPIKGMYLGRRWRQMIQPGDTIRSLVPAVPELSGNPSAWLGGDIRVLALLQPKDDKKDQYFQPHPYYKLSNYRHAHNLRAAAGDYYVTDFDTKLKPSDPDGNVGAIDPELPKFQKLGGGNSYPSTSSPRIFKTDFGELIHIPTTDPSKSYISKNTADLPPTVHGVKSAQGADPDYDGGTGPINDGPYVNKADEGVFTYKVWDSTNSKYFYMIPYYEGGYGTQNGFDAYFSPNRQISSAIQFGSLLTGRKKAWQTLAFSPNPMNQAHPGLAKDPKDHVLADFFQMPVVEPYAISEPFSTGGKININYQIMPFSYIKRTTALRAALQPMRVTAVGPSVANRYKSSNSNNGNDRVSPQFRTALDMDNTIKLFDEYFKGGLNGNDERVFRSASGVCEVYFYPAAAKPTQPTAASMAKWWRDGQILTPDNLRERPYADLYPRITTKSNTYTVYMRVQTLRKRPLIGGSDEARKQAALQWNEGQDQVLAEYRGSATIERYLDPTDRRLSDTTRTDYIDPDKKSLEPIYRFRVIESKRFSPQ